MSKFFGWLKKDKPKSEPQDTPKSTPEAVQAESQQDPVQEAERQENNQHASDQVVVATEVDTSSTVTQPTEVEVTLDEGKVVDVQSIDPEDSVSLLTSDAEKTPAVNATPDVQVPVVIDDSPATVIEEETQPEPLKAQEKPAKIGLFAKLKQSLSRTKENLGSGFVSLFRGKAIDDELFEELETQLLVADVGIDTTSKIITKLTDSAKRNQLKDGDALYQLLKQQMSSICKRLANRLSRKVKVAPLSS